MSLAFTQEDFLVYHFSNCRPHWLPFVSFHIYLLCGLQMDLVPSMNCWWCKLRHKISDALSPPLPRVCVYGRNPTPFLDCQWKCLNYDCFTERAWFTEGKPEHEREILSFLIQGNTTWEFLSVGNVAFLLGIPLMWTRPNVLFTRTDTEIRPVKF